MKHFDKNDSYIKGVRIEVIVSMARPKKIEADDICIQEGEYFVQEKSTLRKLGAHFKKSPSSVRKDLDRLKEIDPPLYSKVIRQIRLNKDQCVYRGGEATKRKYLRKELGVEYKNVDLLYARSKKIYNSNQ